VAGEGYFPSGSATRHVIGDPAGLVGGVSALFLQALHPRAMAGVLQHSSFPDDFWPRLQRTIGYVTTLAFADRATADKAAARVRGIHGRVHGVDPVTGRAYSADDPDLLRWVHVTEVGSIVAAVRRLDIIDDTEADRFLAEQIRAGALVGATDLPASRAEVEAYYADVRPELVASPTAMQAARRLAFAPIPWRYQLLTPARPAWTLVAAVAIGLLPVWARDLYGLPRIPGSDAATTAGLWTIRTMLLTFRTVTGRPAPPQ
jgi:uncharacterized protein (DUF2236 family)